MYGVGLLTEQNWWFVYDGVKIANNCSNITKYQWSYNQGLMLAGCAYLYNYTEEEKWYNYTIKLLESAQVFFKNISGSMVMYEAACQPSIHVIMINGHLKHIFTISWVNICIGTSD